MPPLADLAVGVLAGPLLVAGPAKMVLPPTGLDWPYRSGPLRPPHGPRLVGAGEIAAALGLVLLPGWFGPVLAVAAYAALTLAAHRLRGRTCACFGTGRLAAVGRGHLGLNAAATGLAAAALVAVLLLPEPSRPVLRVLVALGAVAVLTVVSRSARGRDTGPAGCTGPVAAVQLYVSTGCPACRSLRELLAAAEQPRRDAVHTVQATAATPLPRSLTGLGFPCAVGLDTAGLPVCAPVSGIGPVKALIDTITIAPRADTAGIPEQRSP